MSLLQTLRFIAAHPLNQGNAAAALARFVSWQVGARLVPGPVLVPFVEDSKLLLERGMTGATGNLYAGLQEFEEMAFVLHCMRRGDVFADVGANAGAYSVLAAAVCGARCYAFEPVAATFETLLRNLAVNGIGERCIAFRMALGSASGEVAMTTDLGPMNHVVASGESSRTPTLVSVRRLDDALGGAPVTVMKIDVEGYELEVLRGAAATLARQELLAVIAEINGCGRRYGAEGERVFAMLRDAGFAPMRYRPEVRELRPWKADERRGDNVIFVRDTAAVRRRLAEARAVRVRGRYV